jgi:Mg2+-importing ATPase
MATHVISGTCSAIVTSIGPQTEFGKISEDLKSKAPETEFEHGIKHFGYFLMILTLILVMAIFAINVYFARPLLDSVLFSLALAVGLTPQLLPAIISINLSHGARRMAKQKVIIKRLAAIENFGSMNILCSDKTGTLTDGTMQLKSFAGADGCENDKVRFYAYLNSVFETGYNNPIDKAIRENVSFDISNYRKLDEVPYDFIRKRLTILVSTPTGNLGITKGTLPNLFSICSQAETSDGLVDINRVLGRLESQFEEYNRQGFRVLGIAYRPNYIHNLMPKEDEKEFIFSGFIVLFDPPKTGVQKAIEMLKSQGIELKMISGDNRLVTAHVGKEVGLKWEKILTGAEIGRISDFALIQQVKETNIFAEIEPDQKKRIIVALKKANNVVGYIGDGINDAPALHEADVGISVDSAADVAKEAADIVLLEKDLGVLARGVSEGRSTFVNTLKYVFMATSANFGNMFSMAGASIFLSFLPLLPKQVLLTNLMTDIPELNIASDNVDPESVFKPRRWNIKFIQRFMLTFGILSSVFDYVTFGVLLYVFNATESQFRTGWFMESVISASLIVLVIRSRRRLFTSKPGKYLLLSTLGIVVVTLIMPYTPLDSVLGFYPLPGAFIPAILAIVVVYIIAAEMTKRIFFRVFKTG